MVLGPARWLKKLMQLTKMSPDFKIFLLGLGATFLLVGWVFERYMSQPLAKLLGRAKQKMRGASKKRKEYKDIEERMRT
jgi:cation-transporting ATPase 13A3/4/5